MDEPMRTLPVVTFAMVGIGMVLVAAIIADSAGATRADAEGYAQMIAVNRSVTPATTIAKEHALFQR
jgi:hypothetical protein